MSDFEISDDDQDYDNDYDNDDYNNLSFPSDDDGQDTEDGQDSHDEDNDNKKNISYKIDMDDEDTDTITQEPIIKPKLTLKSKQITTINTPNTPNTPNSFNNIFTSEKKVKVETKLTTIQKDKTSKVSTQSIESIESTESKVIPKDIKLTKKEQCFEFNEETIDFFTKDLDFKKILIKNSPFTNDIQVICLLLKYNIITDYCCTVKKCKVNSLWLDKPIQLILHRKNNIENDLSSFNLELICGNCYLCMFGLDIFKKKEKEIVFKCNICSFPLVQFNNQRKKKGTCLACEKKIGNVFTKNIESEYYDKVQSLYNDNPLLSEENKHNYSNYYNYKNGNKYKPSAPKVQDPSSSVSNSSTKPKPAIIHLNMTIPNLDDLFTQ